MDDLREDNILYLLVEASTLVDIVHLFNHFSWSRYKRSWVSVFTASSQLFDREWKKEFKTCQNLRPYSIQKGK